MANGDSRLNKKEIGEISGLSRSSTDKVIASFLEWGIIKQVEKHGGMALYALDLRSPLVICMERFNDAIILKMNPGLLEEIEAAEEEAAHEKHVSELATAKKALRGQKKRSDT